MDIGITNIALSAYLAFGQPVANTREVVRYGGLQAIHADGTLSLRMTEPTRRVEDIAGGVHVVSESGDESYPFFLTRHAVFHDDCDVVETWIEIRHDEEGPVRLVRMDSFASELPWKPDEVGVLTLAGGVQREARVVESRLAPGQTLATSSREGIHNAWESNPAMMVAFGGADESRGDVLGVALEWTGCSAKCVRREHDGRTKVFIGVDNQGGPYVLDPGVTLKTPRALLVLSRKGKGEVSRQFHRWAHLHLMPHGYDLHPVLLNSWEGSYFGFSEKTLTDMMDGVREMGGEMFVLDDGWFGRGRYARDEVNKDTSGLGDWVVNDRKLPHGLGWLSDQAKARGLKFGLWVEPEMANTNSALAVAHPDWLLQEPRRQVLLGRGGSQNTLDLCNPDVRDCVFEQIDAVYSTIPDLAYVKWDANGPISNLGSPSLPRDRQGNLWFDYTMGLCDLLARFQAKRPHVVTQACASGGGHMDFGFLRYADEFWTSDRTDPVDRVLIQWGASQFYPASAMACHVTASPNHQTGRETPLKYRFDVAMSGRLGFELHPKDLSVEDLAYAKERVAQYKRIRPVVQAGDLYRLASPYEFPFAAFMYVSRDKSAAVLFVLGLDRETGAMPPLRLAGLDEQASYLVGSAVRTGTSLMTEGVAVRLRGRYASEVVELRKAEERPVTGARVVSGGDPAWELRRAKAVNRMRPLVYNTDGCDMLYWPTNLPTTVANFTGRRLKDALGTYVSTVSYCPQSAGFGHFTCRMAGEPLTGTVPLPGCRNAAADFFRLGTDSLQMATEFCATNGLEVFVSVRVNDRHDSSSTPKNLSALYPKFKLEHPECIMGDLARGPRQSELYRGFTGWSCVDFHQPLVRETMKRFVRELVENYEVDGIEYDFNRHFMLFRSVAVGGVATLEEVGEMTQLMRDLRAITEEAGRRRNRPVVIAMRMADSVAFDLAVGADIETWFREGLVDIWVGGGYFLLNPLPTSVEVAHRHGVKFYWSLDESRIPRHAATVGLPCLPGRMTKAFYAARFSAAQAAGCDGVYVFNIENEFLRTVASMDPRSTRGLEKVYFAVERGSGGFGPGDWLKDGGRFSRLPGLDPGRPRKMSPGETYRFEMFVGDDFGGDSPPRTTVHALVTGLKSERLSVSVNGTALSAASRDGIDFSADVPPGVLKSGMNEFAVSFPVDASKGATFNDFSLWVLPR